MGILFIVATPIGNLKDTTLRAKETLSKVRIILCEDTRRTQILLKFIKTSHRPTLLSYFEQNEQNRIPQALNALQNGVDVALVSDAGTPTISDPGFKLVRECIARGIRVESIPGPSSVISSLVVSGLPTDKFLFFGYLPKKPGHRKNLLLDIAKMIQIIKATIIIFEAPHKLINTLREIQEEFGDIEIVICRELTKIHEEIRREKISESIKHFEKQTPKGEIVLLFNTAP